MNKTVQRYGYTLVVLLGISLLVALLFVLLMVYSLLSFDSYELIANCLSIGIWILGGIMLGRFVYSKALLCALPIVILYFIGIVFLYLKGTPISANDLLWILLRILSFLLSTRFTMRK